MHLQQPAVISKNVAQPAPSLRTYASKPRAEQREALPRFELIKRAPAAARLILFLWERAGILSGPVKKAGGAHYAAPRGEGGGGWHPIGPGGCPCGASRRGEMALVPGDGARLALATSSAGLRFLARMNLD